MLLVSKPHPPVESTKKEGWNASCLKETLCIVHVLIKYVILQPRCILTYSPRGYGLGPSAGNWILSGHNEAYFTHIRVVAPLKHI
jgi:hypothetical protein